MKKEKQIKAVILEPFKKARIETIENSLETIQGLVGGYIEVLKLNDYVDIILNEEGKLIGLEPNFRFKHDVVVGTVVFVSHRGAEFASLHDDWIEYITEIFGNTDLGKERAEWLNQ